MSIEAMTWALSVPVGGNAKVVLLGLANHAHPDGTESYPALDTLAVYAHVDRSTARRNVRKLVADGWAIEDGLGPKGQTKYRLAMTRTEPPKGGGKMPPVAERNGLHPGPGGGGTAMPPEPSIEPSTSRNESAGARATTADKVPDDFPDALRPHARRVMAVLRTAAERRGARRVTARAVALTLMARPHKPLVTAAHDCAAWIEDHPEVACRDVMSRYRRWLDKEPDLQGLERLDSNGVPTTSPPGRPGNVRPIRGAGAVLRALDEADAADAAAGKAGA